MIIAIVENYKVTAINNIENESDVTNLAKNSQAVIDITNIDPRPEIGWFFDGISLLPTSGGHVESKKITKLAFRKRFSNQELATIYTLAKQNVSMQIYLDDLQAAKFIDLSRGDTINAINSLAQLGIISQLRAQEILTNQIQEIEIFKE